jgi:ketopantoate reductase
MTGLVNATRNLQSLVLMMSPHGGQHSARKNAWASMAQDAQRARQRREAEAAVGAAIARAERLAQAR